MTCAEPDCGNRAWARGYCVRHYGRRYAAGLAMCEGVNVPYSVRLYANDIDGAVVERLMAGGYNGWYTAFERREAVRRLRSAGLSLSLIAARVGVSPRQVCRDLKRVGFVSSAASRSGVAVETG